MCTDATCMEGWSVGHATSMLVRETVLIGDCGVRTKMLMMLMIRWTSVVGMPT